MTSENTWADDGITYIYNGGTVDERDKIKIIHVLVGDSVTEIKHHAFSYCNYLQTVNLTKSDTTRRFAPPLEQIHKCAFWYCTRLVSVTLPSTLTEIDHGTFYFCTSLKTIKFSSPTEGRVKFKLNRIGCRAFQGCENLEKIEIPPSVELIGTSAFANCNKLSVLSFGDPIPTDDDDEHTDEIENNNNTTMSINNNVNDDRRKKKQLKSLREICSRAFVNCRALEKIRLPQCVEAIGVAAFDGCSKLAIVNVPENIKLVCERAFPSWGNLGPDFNKAINFRCDINRWGRKFLSETSNNMVYYHPGLWPLVLNRAIKGMNENIRTPSSSRHDVAWYDRVYPSHETRIASFAYYLLTQSAIYLHAEEPKK